MPSLRFAVLGMGRWGKQWQSVLSAAADSVVTATASRRPRPDRVPLQAGRRSFAYHYQRYTDAIADPEVDAVLITLPVHLHAAAIIHALSCGKHVLCEKPVVASPEELTQVREVARRHPDLVVMVAQNYRLRPWAKATSDLVAAGAVGDLGRVAVRFSQPEFLDGGRGEMASPLLDDMSIHHLDLLRYLTNREATAIFVREYRPSWSRFREAPAVEAIIELEGGLVANYSGSWAARGLATPYDGEYRLEGDRGTLAVTERNITLELPGVAAPVTHRLISEVERADTTSDLHAVLEEFSAAVRNGSRPGTDLDDNSRSMALLFAARASVASGRPEQVHVAPVL